MEEYFARQRRRRLIAIAVGLVVAIVAFVAVLFANFRTNSNYRFQSVADFFYQTLTSRKLTYDFVDQNISEVEVGPHVLRTMSVEIDGEIQLIQAVKLRTFWGSYYKFPLVSFEATTASMTAKAHKASISQVYALFLEDGVLINVLSDTLFEDTNGSQGVVTDGVNNLPADPSAAEHCQYFWVSGELPFDFALTSADGTQTFTYSNIMDSYYMISSGML